MSTLLNPKRSFEACVPKRSLGTSTGSLASALRRFLAILALCLLIPTSTRADDPSPAGPITIHPAAVRLTHPRQPQSLAVMGSTAEGFSIDLSDGAKFESADPAIARIDERGWVYPLATGTTQLTVTTSGQSLTVPVTVELPAATPDYSFRHEVMAVLSKTGCNMGACHGYSLGKNGFKLSLRGSDPELDFAAITKEQFGRRVNLQSPAASLLFAKPVGDAPHEGGLRFRRNSLAGEIVSNWIRQGAPGDLADTARVVKVQLVPERVVLRPRQKHHLQLIAHYNDGTSRDVTRLGAYTANNTQFAEVDDEGLVTAQDAGETAIVARFERTFAATGILVLNPDSEFVPTPVPADNLIDRPVVEKLNRLKIIPSPPAGDEQFLRRVHLDLIGVQPKPDEIKAFLADADPGKRARVVEALFDRPEFVDHWSLKWGDLLSNSRNIVSQQSVYLFREFLRGAIAENLPLDEFARRMLTARGAAIDDPASTYLAISKDTNDTVERTTQVFCGVRMLCARCHTHPLENWTQADYYGLASFFSQVSPRQDPRFSTIPNSKLVQVNLAAGPATNPRSGRPQPPRFLGAGEPELTAGADRREAYARWLTAPENPFFARGLVNRFWSYFFHRGVIEPVDDVRSTNPPINPELLDALTRDFLEHRYDARHLMRRIVTSATYQRSSTPTPSNRRDEQNFSHAIPRRVPAEALLDSLVQATGIPEAFGGVPGGFRAAQLPDAAVDNSFLNLFGKPQRMDACECERDNNSNMLQALHFINGQSILGRVKNPAARPTLLVNLYLPSPPGGKVAGGEGAAKPDSAAKPGDAVDPAADQLITDLYLWSLARHPTSEELKLARNFLASYAEKPLEAAQDLMWALLNSRDFLLVH